MITAPLDPVPYNPVSLLLTRVPEQEKQESRVTYHDAQEPDSAEQHNSNRTLRGRSRGSVCLLCAKKDRCGCTQLYNTGKDPHLSVCIAVQADVVFWRLAQK